LCGKRALNLKERETMAKDRPKLDQGNNPSSENPPIPKPEVIDIGPRIIQEGEEPGNCIEIIQDIEKQ
jgi:hypothetical protein